MHIAFILISLLAVELVCLAILRLGKAPEKTRKIRIAACLLLSLLYVAVLFNLNTEKDPWDKYSVKYKNLGVPYLEFYSDEQKSSRLSDDLAVFDGRLYVGGGDYDKNTGPLPIRSYDLAKGGWTSSKELIPDEQIKRFEVLGGKLLTLGTDPKEDWNLGNYYVLENGIWNTLRVLPDGVHCFDAIEFGEEIFFGLGVTSGKFPVARFDGERYSAVDFLKNGEKLDTSENEIVRVYNLFEHKGVLYAFLTFDVTNEKGEKVYLMDLYAYDGKAFSYESGSLPAEDMREVVSEGNRIFLILGNTLLSSEDLLCFSALKIGDRVNAVDVIRHNGEIYLLATRKIDKENYYAAIFKHSENDRFDIVYSFKTDTEAGAFCRDGNSFYVSLGRRENPDGNKSAGQVIKISIK
ncbi:MAG: hypothetical protein IJW79_10705 [Clostridia bacterium]|nr:hypothetical protein [Clostridia bacterium]